MLLIVAGILVVLWFIGFVFFPVLGWFVHLALVLAAILALVSLFQGTKSSV